MKKRSLTFGLGLLAVLAVMLMVALAGINGQSAWLFQPVDGKPFYAANFQTNSIVGLWGRWSTYGLGFGLDGKEFHPSRLLAIMFPPLVFHVARYVFSVMLTGLAAFWFLRGRRVSAPAAMLAGVFLAFAGYYFSLISAGHTRVFDMMPFAVLAFGCLDRGIARGAPRYLAWAGLCAGFGVVSQPDVMGLFGLLLVAYGLFRFVVRMRRTPSPVRTVLAPCVIGGVLAALTFSATALSGHAFLSRTLAIREESKQARNVSQWEYATNWSMPPEEILEFVAPCVFGIETGKRTGPYWGRLGRSMGWPDKPGLANLKQHNVYLGALPLLFGLYAAAIAFRRRKQGDGMPPEPEVAQGAVSRIDHDEGLPRGEIIFWASAFVIIVMLAMGRYFPLYRVFFSLPVPFASRIRCPVKFMHLGEMSLCFLFGMGLDAFFAQLRATHEGHSDRVFGIRTFTIIGLGLAGVLFVSIPLVDSFAAGLRTYWEKMGLAPLSDTILTVIKGALAHGGAIALIGGGVFGAAWLIPRSKWLATALGATLFAVIAVDAVTVGRRYVPIGNVRPWYAPNPIAERILSADREQKGRTAYLVSRPTWKVWPFGSLMAHGVDVVTMTESGNRLPPHYEAFRSALRSNPVRFWELTNTRFIMGEAKQLEQLIAMPGFETVTRFDLANGRYVERQALAGRFLLVRNDRALPRAMVYHSWRAMPQDAALEALTSTEWNPRQEALVGTNMAGRTATTTPSACEIETYQRPRIVLSTDIAEEGLLVLADTYDDDWAVRVDGEPVAPVRANVMMRGVRLPPGKHTVEMTYRPYLVPFLLSVGTCLALLLWTGGAWVANRRRATSP